MSILKKAMIALLLVVAMLLGAFSIIGSALTTSSGLTYEIVDQYTIGDQKYSVARVSKDYDGIKKDSIFFLDSNGKVVTEKEVYKKLNIINLTIDGAEIAFRNYFIAHKDEIQAYYDVYAAIHLSEKVGNIVSKGCVLTLNLLAPEPFSIAGATLEIAKEALNADALIYNSIFLIYSQNSIIYANKALSFTDEDLKNYENAMTFLKCYDECVASAMVVRELAKEDMDEAKATTVLKELSKYFKNVFVGIAEEFLKFIEVIDYTVTTIVDLGGIVEDIGIADKYDEYLSSHGIGKRYYDIDFPISDTLKAIAKHVNGVAVPDDPKYATIEDGIYNIRNFYSNLMMNVYAGKNADKTNVVTWVQDGTVDQKFYIQHVGNGKYVIYAVCSASGNSYKRCIDIYTGAASTLPKAGDNVNIYTRSSVYNTAQYFYIKSAGDNSYIIECCSVDGLVITASAPKKNNGNICVNNYTGSSAQKWKFELVKSDSGDFNTENNVGGNATVNVGGNINSTIAAKMDKVLATYKPGKSYFTKNGKACSSCHSNNAINCVNTPSACNCLRYVTIDGKKVDLLAVQCFGYARYWQQILFGSHEKNSTNFKEISGVSGKLTATNARVWFTNNKSVLHTGTHIRVYNSKPADGHSIVLLNVDYNAGTVTYIDCNWSGRCAVGNITTLTWAKFASKFGTLHYASVYKDYYTKYPNTQANKLTVSYNANGGVIGKTYKVTDSVGLRVRSGPGTNYDRIGLYKVNTTFIVTEYKKMSDYTWGKVFYDGQYGWVAVNSEWTKEITSTYSVASSMVCKGGNTMAFEHQLTYGIVSNTGVYNHTTFGLYKEGAGFLGWSTSPDGSTEIFDADRALRPEEIVPALANGDKSVTLYAIWDDMESHVTYTVSYDVNGGIGTPESQTKEKGVALTLSHSVPTRTGYIFMGWSTDVDDFEATYQPSDFYANDANIVMYAIWEPDPEKLTLNVKNKVSIDLEEMKYYSFTPSESGKYGIYSFDSEDSVVFLYDSEFNELYADDDGGEGSNFCLTYDFIAGKTYIFGIRFCDTEISDKLNFVLGKSYTVSYNANGGSNVPMAQYKLYESTLTLSDIIPIKTGYTFMGWATSNNSTNPTYKAGGSYTDNADMTLFAVWKQNVVEDNSQDGVEKDDTIGEETVLDKETSDATANDNADKSPNEDDDKKNDSEKSGCGSSIALSGLAIVGAISAAFACKKKKEN